MPQFLIVDIRIDFRPVQLTDIKATVCTTPKNKTFLAFIYHSVEKLVAKYMFRGLIRLADATFVDFALVYLPIVLTFRDNQQRLIQPRRIEVLGYNERIADMCLCNIFLLAPILGDLTLPMPKGRGFLVQRPLRRLRGIGVLHDLPKREFPCAPRYVLFPFI